MRNKDETRRGGRTEEPICRCFGQKGSHIHSLHPRLRDHITLEASIKDPIFLPIWMSGIGFISSKETRNSAYTRSILSSANLIVRKLITADGPLFLLFCQTFDEAKSNPNLVLEEDFRLADMWEMPLSKFQRILSRLLT